ncbi:MAG: methylglyoxal synthase [Planctomyces sp.]
MIALIAHDALKTTMHQFVSERLSFFREQTLVATGNTGRMLQEQLGLRVERVAHGPSGGDLIIGGRVAEGRMTAVLFFRDPLTAQPHEPDVSALMRVGEVPTAPLATNPAPAAAEIRGLETPQRGGGAFRHGWRRY